MKNKILFLFISLASYAAVHAQSTLIKLKQLEKGTQDQTIIAGSDGAGRWVNSPFMRRQDSATQYTTAYDKTVLLGNVIISGTFTNGTLKLLKQSGLTVDIGLDGRYILSSDKGAANGVAPLGADGRVPQAYLPAQTISDVFTVGSQAAMLALSTATQGDFAVRTDNGNTYVLNASDPSVIGNWVLITNNAGISSVNGKSGTSVTLITDDIAEGPTNKYFTNTLARNAVSGTAPINYNATTGAFSLATSGITANTTYNNVQFDVYGRAIVGSNVTYTVPADLVAYYTKTDLQTGGSANVHWNNITNKPSNLGATETKQRFTAGTSTTLTLTNTPAFPTAVEVFLNGQLIDTPDYSISGVTLTLGFTRESSDVITVKYSY